MLQIHPETRKEWREWLRKNHKKKSKVFLISWKRHTKKHSFSHNEALREAICFGWIDTTIKRLDEDRFQRCFVRRNNKSSWSKNTLRYAEEEIKKRRMSKFGMQMYEFGKNKKVIDHELRPTAMSEEFKKSLTGKALENFNNFAPSYKKFYIYWVESAKRPETRTKRIKAAVKRARDNKKPAD